MKRLILVLLLLRAAAADEINNGDSYDRVISVLGKPKGVVNAGSYKLLTYERGKIELQDDKVISSDLLTPEQLDAKREDDKRKAEEMQRASEARYAEGVAVRKAKLKEAAFVAAPASERLAYWEWFRKNYPEVNVDGEYEAARTQVEEARREEDERNRVISELESRVESAEARADEAERKNDVRDDYIYYDSLAYPRPSVVIPVEKPDRPVNIRPTPR